MNIEHKIVGITKDVIIGAMDQHAKTISILFHEFMFCNAGQMDHDKWHLVTESGNIICNIEQAYDIFVKQLTGGQNQEKEIKTI